MKRSHLFSARNIAYFSVLLALVVVLQTCGGFFVISGTSLSFVLVPIVLGSVLLGPIAGGLLGFVFGFIVLMYGVAGTDPFTATLFADTPVMTTLICLVKGIAAGVVPGVLYRALRRVNDYVAIIVAALSAPIVNTGLFILGAFMISGTIGANFTESGSLSEVAYFLFIGCAGINFLIEFAINLVLAPALHRVVVVAERYYSGKTSKKETPQADGETAQKTDGETNCKSESIS